MARKQKFQILHISDFHIDEKDKIDRSVVLDPLIERVKQDVGKRYRPEIVVATGDIAFSVKKASLILKYTFSITF